MKIEYRALSERGFNYLVFWYSLFWGWKKVRNSIFVFCPRRCRTSYARLNFALSASILFLSSIFPIFPMCHGALTAEIEESTQKKALGAKKKFYMFIFPRIFIPPHKNIFHDKLDTCAFSLFSLALYPLHESYDGYFPSLLHFTARFSSLG